MFTDSLTAGGALLTAFLLFNGNIAAQVPPALTTLHAFTGRDESNPTASVVGSGGVLYGTTQTGGTSKLGVVFSLAAPMALCPAEES